MRILPEKSNVISLGQTETIEFKTKHDSKILLEVLSDKVYSDKVLAVVRELMTNAREVSEEIHLWYDKNYFKIRDFGPGLDEEGIKKTFCQFLYSTKDESDEFVGGYGIGAKTPFLATDSFIVKSYQKGVETTYRIYINNETYSLEYEKLEEKSTSERDGLEIEVRFEKIHAYEYSLRDSILEVLFTLLPVKIRIFNRNLDKTEDLIHSMYQAYMISTLLHLESTESYDILFGQSRYESVVYPGIMQSWPYSSNYKVRSYIQCIFKKPNEFVSVPANREGLTFTDEFLEHVSSLASSVKDITYKYKSLRYRDGIHSRRLSLHTLYFATSKPSVILVSDEVYNDFDSYNVSRRTLSKIYDRVGRDSSKNFIVLSESKLNQILSDIKDQTGVDVKPEILFQIHDFRDLKPKQASRARSVRKQVKKYKYSFRVADKVYCSEKWLTPEEAADIIKRIYEDVFSKEVKDLQDPRHFEVNYRMSDIALTALPKEARDMLVELREVSYDIDLINDTLSNRVIKPLNALAYGRYQIIMDRIDTLPDSKLKDSLKKLVESSVQVLDESFDYEFEDPILNIIPDFDDKRHSAKSYVIFINTLVELKHSDLRRRHPEFSSLGPSLFEALITTLIIRKKLGIKGWPLFLDEYTWDQLDRIIEMVENYLKEKGNE